MKNIDNIVLAETFYIGCENDGSVAELGVHPTIRWDRYAVYSFNDMREIFSDCFCNTQLLYQEKCIDKPTKYAMLLPIVDSKKKINDKQTYHETICWFIENMLPPKSGIIISLYFYNSPYPQMRNLRSTDKTSIWPFKKLWKGKGNYITVQKLENLTQSTSDKISKGHLDIINDIENISQYEVKYIDYTMRIDYVYDLLINTKMHITYDGASWHLAAMLDTPTIVYGKPMSNRDIHYWHKTKDEKVYTTIRESRWHKQTIQYDIDKDIVYAGPQTFSFNVNSKKELTDKIKNI